MRSRRFILIFIISLTVILLIFKLFGINHRQTHSVDFSGVDNTTVDSIVTSMSDSAKINLLFIVSNSADTIHSIFVKNTKTNQYYKKISDSIFQRPFVVTPFFNNFEDFPAYEILKTIVDTNVRRDYLNTLAFLDNIAGFNFFLINKNYSNIRNIKQIKNAFHGKNVFITLPMPDINLQDTSEIHKLKNFYDTAFQFGANSLIVNSRKELKTLEQLDFSQFVLATDTIFDDAKSFLLSDADMIFCDTIDSIFIKDLQKLIKRKKYENLLDAKVKNIIKATLWTNLNNEIFNIDTEKIFVKIDLIKRKLSQSSIVCLKNKDDLLPLKNVYQRLYIIFLTKKFENKKFTNIIKKYNNNIITKKADISKFDASIFKNISKKDIVVIVSDTAVDTLYQKKLQQIDTTYQSIFISIGKIPQNINSSSLLYAPIENELTAKYLAQAIYGGIEVTGKLQGLENVNLPKTRLGYDIPEMANLDSKKLQKIDSIVYDAIRKGAFPGCQVFIAKNGIVVWDKSYGWHTYSKRITVKPYDVYDVASVTKIMATTLAAMKMYEQRKLALDKPIGKYYKDTHIEYTRIKPDTIVQIDTLNIKKDTTWEDFIKDKDTTWIDDTLLQVVDTIFFKATPKNNIFKVTPRQLLMHKSGILPVLPILPYMLIPEGMLKNIKSYYKNKKLLDSLSGIREEMRKKYYSDKYIEDSAEIKVAKGMYLKNNYFDTLWEETKALPVSSKKNYIYSDVNMILLQMTIDTINGYSLDRYVRNNFYKPLGLRYTNFLPIKYYKKTTIIPTEDDKYWRRQLLQGYVHDPSAAILGGVAGNAGLFSNAEGLGIIGQMILNGGTYGGKRFLKAETIGKFTATQPDSYRGLGFDKWAKKQIIAPSASPNTFGHTGFTGTCVWIDPDNQIVFVFLSNRVHPKANNWRINRLKVRQKVHEVVYEAIINDDN